MKGFFKKPYRFGICYGVALALIFVFILLDTFVIPKTGTAAQTEENNTATYATAEVEESEATTTDTTYKDENMTITLTTTEQYDTVVYIADIEISDISLLKTAFAQGTYGRNIDESTSDMAADNNAVLAINGDYYGFRDNGYVLRNGKLYRDTSSGNEDLAILSDGSFTIFDEDEASASSLVEEGALQVLSFGPALVNAEKSWWEKAKKSANP